MAMRNGIKVTIWVGFIHIHIEGDNKILIQVVIGHIQIPWEIQVLVQDINTYFQLCNNIVITNIFREGNGGANWLDRYDL